MYCMYATLEQPKSAGAQRELVCVARIGLKVARFGRDTCQTRRAPFFPREGTLGPPGVTPAQGILSRVLPRECPCPGPLWHGGS